MTPKTMTTPPGPEPANVLSPAELAKELVQLADDALSFDDKQAVRQAEAALVVARARVDRAGEKQLRILRAKSIEEAQAILVESAIDLNLKLLCQKRSGWKPLREKGATDEQIKQLLAKRSTGWPDYRSQNNVPSAEVGYSGFISVAVWVDPDESCNGKPHLSGQKLIDAVRRVMGIKKPAGPGPAGSKKKPSPPQKPSPKPTPAKRPAAKPKAPPAPTQTPAPDDDNEMADADEDLDSIGGDAEASAPLFVDVATMKLLGEIYSGDTASEKKPHLRGLFEPGDGTQWACTGCGFPPHANGVPDEADLYRAVRPAEFKGKTKQRPEGKPGAYYEGLRVTCEGKPYVLTGPRRRAELAKVVDGKPRPIAKPAPGPRKLTWGQWAATLRGIRDEQKLSADVPQRKDLTERERFFLTQFEIVKRPSEARDAWIKQAGASMAAAINEAAGVKPGVLPSVTALAKPQTPMPAAEDDDTTAALQSFVNRGAQAQAAVDALLEDEDDDDRPDAKCRVCGCTEEDCRECIEATGAACSWVDDPIRMGDLCSRCKPEEYGRRVSGEFAGSGVRVEGLRIIGQGERNGELCFQVNTDGDGDGELWVRVEGSLVEADTADTDTWDDPNVDGRGFYVSGVKEIWVRGQAMNDKAKIVIRVAKGADGMHRTGHLLEFREALALQASSEEPVKLSGQAVASEAYAVKTRAEILINLINAAPGEKGAAWSPAQKAAYFAAIKALESFIANNPACKERKPAKAGAA